MKQNKHKKGAFLLCALAAIGFALGMGLSACDTSVSPIFSVCSVNYQTEYGTAPNTKVLLAGTTLGETELPTLEADGQTFGGWFDGETQAIAGKYSVTKNVTLVAKWTAVGPTPPPPPTPTVEYTVTFDSDGGSAVESQKVKSGEKATKPADPTKMGVLMAGWYNGENVFDFNTPITADITLKAKWTLFYNLKTGPAINNIIETQFKAAKKFLKSPTAPETTPQYYLDIDEKSVPLWYDSSSKTIYYYVAEGKLCLNADSSKMFYAMDALEEITVSDFDTRNVTNMSQMFLNNFKLATIDLHTFDVSNVTDMSCMFDGCLGATSINLTGWNTSKVTNMSRMFINCQVVASLDISSLNVSKVTNMSEMFQMCKALTSLDLSNWDVSNVTNMTKMFADCNALTSLDLHKWNVSNVTDMSYMFQNCKAKLTTLNLSSWNVSKVTNMSYMFDECNSLKNLDITGWDTSKVTDMSMMFHACVSLPSSAIEGNKLNVGNVTNMERMLDSCFAFVTIDLSSWNVSKVTNMNKMFLGDGALTTIYVAAGTDWGASGTVTTSTEMFNGCGALRGGAGTGLSNLTVTYARVDDPTNSKPGYFTVKPANP